MFDNESQNRLLLKCCIRGAISLAIMLFLLLCAAIVLPYSVTMQKYMNIISKICLLICAILCGGLCSKITCTKKFPVAMLGEAFLLAFIIIAELLNNTEFRAEALLIDIVVLIFGGFAGTVWSDRKGSRRKKRKVYRT